MDHFWTIASAIFAVALVVAVSTYAHCASTAAIYTSTQQSHSNGSDPTIPASATWAASGARENSNFLLCLAREGAKWSHKAQFEARMWCIVLLVLVFAVIGYVAKMRV